MKYFKILENNIIIGAITSKDFMRYLPATDCFIRTNEEKGEYITYNSLFYRSTWMKPIVKTVDYKEVIILPIEKEEYKAYVLALETNEVIVNDLEEEILEEAEESDYVDPIKQASLDFIRESKINELSYNCRKTIENGFDLELNNEKHHFSLTMQDQLNLMSLEPMLETIDQIPYHADGEEEKFYTSEEIKTIITAANDFKRYQIAYHNALKNYVNALDTIEEISAITYGVDIPEKFKTEVLISFEHK